MIGREPRAAAASAAPPGFPSSVELSRGLLPPYVRRLLRGTFLQGPHPTWSWTVGTLDGYDPHRVFTTPCWTPC
ncbi:hypothetical protein [Streptomyces syringium]|uniref:hypothetical protein n=1 Tax=Streptomyces syringium TaxID=76729 RepID=UPI003452C932